MKTTRLEAFSDGVLAIIITIMVLELKVPHAVELSALTPLLRVLLSYVLSFIYIGIYWNNHHHLFQATEQVSGGILWARRAFRRCDHRSQTASASTQSRKSSHTTKFSPWKLITCVAFTNQAKAEVFERYLKSGSGHAFVRKRLW